MGIFDISKRHLRKQPKDVLPIRFRRKKSYVFFTWHGLFQWFALTVIAAFSFNYNNNLSLMFVTFLGLFFLSVLFRNYFFLKKVQLVGIFSKPCEEGQETEVVFEFTSTLKKEIPMVWMDIAGQSVPVHFTSSGLGQAVWKVTPSQYGVFYVPYLCLYTLWPQGMNRTWVFAKPQATLAVAPKRIADQSNGIQKGYVEDALLLSSPMGDPDGVRLMHPNEQAKIAWRHTLKHQKPMTYTYTASQKQVMIIDWPSDESSVDEKLLYVRRKIDTALDGQMMFQLRHPDYVSTVGGGAGFAVVVLCGLVDHVLPPQIWPGSDA